MCSLLVIMELLPMLSTAITTAHRAARQARAGGESVCKLLMLNAADGSQCGNPFRYVATVG